LNNQPRVCIIILNYNGFEDTVECINSLKDLTYQNIDIVLVDNCSTDGSVQMLESACPDIKVIRTERNLGYAGGNNAGIKYALENSAEYICLLNNDVVVEKDFLERVIEKIEVDGKIGIAGPKVCEYYDRDTIQSTGSAIKLYTGRVPRLNSGKKSSDLTEDLYVDYIGGACLIIKREVIESIGFIPEEYFLFFEETEWCLRAKKAGYRIMCVCSSRVFHKGSSSVSKVKGLQDYYMMRNNFVFEKRNANTIQLCVFIVYKVLRYMLTFIKGVAIGRLDKDLQKGFLDGLKYKARRKRKFN